MNIINNKKAAMNSSKNLSLITLVLLSLSFSNQFSVFNSNRNCEELSQDECSTSEVCYWRYGECISYEWEDECESIESEAECNLLGCNWDNNEGCYRPESSGNFQCLQDCPGFYEINPEQNPNETCDWVVSVLSNVDPGFASCFIDCEEELTSEIIEIVEACYECLQNEDINCSDLFEDEDADDWDEDGNEIDCETLEEDDCREFDFCYWSDEECSFADNDEDDWDDGDWNNDGGDNMDFCIEFDETMCENMPFCEWTDEGCVMNEDMFAPPCSELSADECEEGLFCMLNDAGECVDDWGSEDDGGWNDDGGDFEVCAELSQDECRENEFCDWSSITTPNGFFEICVETNNWNDDGGWDDGGQDCNPDLICGEMISCWENGFLYPTTCGPENCDMPIGPCDDGEDDGGNNILCSDINNPFECIGSGCEWVGGNVPGAGYCVDENTDDCDPNLMCGGALTCVGGLLYPTTCGPDNCDEPIGDCEDLLECEDGEFNNENPCNPFECFNGQWYEIVIDCAEQMGVPCENGEYVDPPEGECCSICVEYDNDPDATLYLGNAAAVPNSEVSIPFYIDSNEPVGGLQFEIHSPLHTGGNGSFVNPSSIESIIDCFNTEFNVIDNSLLVIMFSLEGCTIDPGENYVANINYYIPGSASLGQNIPLEFTSTIVSDQFGNEISSRGESGSILIGMQGDINGDNQVNVSDIVLAVNFAISSQVPNEYQLWAGDINDDEMVNVLDIVTIVNMILN